MTSQEMVARGRRHTALRAELNRQGPLHRHERDLLLDAADALLFDEPEARQRKAEALELLDALQAAGRRTSAEAGRVREALEGCGGELAAAELAAA
jgi:hypothetical protein